MDIKRKLKAVFIFFALLIVGALQASELPSYTATGPHIQVTLMAENQQLKPGINWLGVHFSPHSQWHTYWRNPGDSGEAPTIQWQLPEGVTAGDIQWPIPKPIKVAHLVNYGYESDNLLMVPINIEESVLDPPANTSLNIVADVSWLVCKEDCIPGWATLSKTFPVNGDTNSDTTPSTNAPLFSQTRNKMPDSAVLNAVHEINQNGLVVSVPMSLTGDWQLLPFRSDVVQHNGEQSALADDAQTSFVLRKSDYFNVRNEPLMFLLTDGEQGRYLQSDLNIVGGELSINLLLFIAMAFAGGLILNLMPCVLPVLAIKAMSANQSSSRRVVKLGYAAGVLVSFNLFALLILGLKSTGESVGWGFHMQEPLVIVLLAFLFTFIALILMDIAPQGTRISGIGQNLVNGQSVSSQFFTGVLAVVVASPCTAPFMAAALGIAMVSDAITSLLIFNALALGFALPLTMIFFIPKLANALPKPGQWMVRFRQFLAFPMLATVLWLGWIYLQQTSALDQLVLFACLLMFSLALWLSSILRRGNLFIAALAMLIVAIPLYQSHTRAPQLNQAKANDAFSPERLANLRQQNKVVLINMTADWCITCKVNEQVAFQSEDLTNMLASDDVHYLVGDWTNKNQQILKYLNHYQRSGVPLYVVYAGEAAGQVLPQILTADIVVEALEKAIKETQNEA